MGLARSMVAQVVERAAAAGLAWPLPPETTDAVLSAAIFKRDNGSSHRSVRRRAQSNWAALHLELKRPNVAFALLWDEYRQDHPEGYG